jgi:flavin reductase (DIM6/NTAB) family NADH-FMN oxidoreductase RutF
MMGLLWSPIVAVTSAWRSKNNVQIAVSVGAASIVPSRPRVVVQIYKGNFSHRLIHRSSAFALNFLRQDQLHLIKAFGFVSGKEHDKLANINYETKATGSPILKDCWGFLDCRVINGMDGGDMTCFLAEVLEGDIISDGAPLWWRDARLTLPPEWLEEWERKRGAEIERSIQIMDQIDYTFWNPLGQKRL